MNIGSLAQRLMKQTIALAGDGAKEISIRLLGDVTYDPSDGSYSAAETVVPIGKALVSQISEAESVRYKLTTTSHKLVVAMLDYQNSGAEDPETYDEIEINSVKWKVEKVVTGPFSESVVFFVCQPA